MKRFIAGQDRSQHTLFPESLEDDIAEDNPVRAVDVSVDGLDLAKQGFDGVQPEATGRPSYYPALLLKLSIYGYLNRIKSSRPLEWLETVRAQISLIPDHTAQPDEPVTTEDAERQSQASALVLFIKERCELFHDQNQEVYAKDIATHETRRIESRAFKDWLVSGFFEQTQKSARDQSVREAISTLSGLGRFTGQCRDVSVRVAAHSTGYYLDLGQKGNSRAVRIYPGGWECTDNPPACFVRPETLRPIPEPARGGNLSQLWDIANIPKCSQLLVIAWLCECLRPDTPLPVLELIGEQGSAKSNTQTALPVN